MVGIGYKSELGDQGLVMGALKPSGENLGFEGMGFRS